MTLKRVRFIQELLRFVGLEGRVHLAWISSAEAGRFVRVVTEFTEKIRRLGPSPIQRSVPIPAAGPRRCGPSMLRALPTGQSTRESRPSAAGGA